jgi:hypothetical protein
VRDAMREAAEVGRIPDFRAVRATIRATFRRINRSINFVRRATLSVPRSDEHE